MVTKKDFEAVANAIRMERDFVLELEPEDYQSVDPKIATLGTIDKVVSNIVDYFAEQNPNFNREKFIEACGL